MTYGPSATITSRSAGSLSLPSPSGAGKPSREPSLDVSARLVQGLKEAGEGDPCVPEGSPPLSSCSGFRVGFPSQERGGAVRSRSRSLLRHRDGFRLTSDPTQWSSPRGIKHLRRKRPILFSLLMQMVQIGIYHLLSYDEISVPLHKERQQKIMIFKE